MRCGGFGNGSTTTLNIYPYLAHHQVGAGVDEEEETRVPGRIPESSLSLERTGRWTEARWDPQAPFVLFHSPCPSCHVTSI